MTRDPIGSAGGMNLYAYCDGDPINAFDPYGYSAWSWYMDGMGGFSYLVDDNVMDGSTVNFGNVTGEYDSGQVSIWKVAKAGGQWAFQVANVATAVVGGGGLAVDGVKALSSFAKIGVDTAIESTSNISLGSIESASTNVKNGQRFLIGMSKRSAEDVDSGGMLDIVAHGNSKQVEINSVTMDAEKLADYIRQHPQFNVQDIRLLSCKTGEGDASIAQALADKLEVKVYAPTT